MLWCRVCREHMQAAAAHPMSLLAPESCRAPASHQQGLCFPILTAHSYLVGQVRALYIQDFTAGGRIRMAIRTKGNRVLSPPSTALNSHPRFQQDAPIEGREQGQRGCLHIWAGLRNTVRGCRELPGTVCSLP